MLDIMMLLDTNHLSDIRKEFMDAEDGLELVAFVEAMLKYLSQDNVDQNHLVASLCELFAQVDVNGDATMEWDEFYEYIHEQGMAEPDMERASMMKYNPRPVWEDRTLPKRVDSMTYYDLTDWVGIAEHNSVHLQVYDIVARKPVHTLTHKAAVLTSLWVDTKGKKYIVVSTCDYAITVWDTQSVWEASGFAVVSNKADGTPMMVAPDSQMSLMWEQETSTLYSGGVNGVMHTWDLATLEAKPHKMQCVRDGNKSSVRAMLNVPTLNGVLSGTLDGSMMLWDKMGSKKPRKVYKGHRNGIIAIAYSATLKMIVSAGIRDELLVWNPFVEKVPSALLLCSCACVHSRRAVPWGHSFARRAAVGSLPAGSADVCACGQRVNELVGHRAAMLGLHLVESGGAAVQLLSSDKAGVFKVCVLSPPLLGTACRRDAHAVPLAPILRAWLSSALY